MIPNRKQEKVKPDKFTEVERGGKIKNEGSLFNMLAEKNEQTINDAKLIRDALNQSLQAFTPDLLFEQLVQDYKTAKNIYGESLIKQLSGYDSNYVEKNIKIPEFQRELKKKMHEQIKDLKKKNLLDNQNTITEKGIELASLVLYMEELDKLDSLGLLGERYHKQEDVYGDPTDNRIYKKGDHYKDLSVRKSVKTALKRQHSELEVSDLKVHTRQAKGKCQIIYALDASGSMKGKKIETCKKAGIALAYQAIEQKDEVGLMVFGKEVTTAIEPGDDFGKFLKEITRIKAMQETSIANAIDKAVELFTAHDGTKHILLLTDAQPTVGEDPIKETLKAAEKAIQQKVSISIIGIDMDKKGQELAQEITTLCNGKLRIVKEIEHLDLLVLEDYENT